MDEDNDKPDDEYIEALHDIASYICGTHCWPEDLVSPDLNLIEMGKRIGRDRVIAFAKTLPPFEEHYVEEEETLTDPELLRREAQVRKAFKD